MGSIPTVTGAAERHPTALSRQLRLACTYRAMTRQFPMTGMGPVSCRRHARVLAR